jgi:two-component system, chemotaxis family, chemotaxis protein CheY
MAEQALQGVRRVLVVDDYATMRRIVRHLLSQIGLNEVDEADNGASALSKLREHGYDLVISDWNMVPMSGFELLKEVRADRHLRKMRFIMITAEGKTDNVAAAAAAGVNGYIVKPFTAETLRKKIEAVLAA